MKKQELEPWETDIGSSETDQRLATNEESQAIDDIVGLQQFTIRLQKGLVADLKELAKQNGIGYQPYVRLLLTQHVNQHKKELARS